jgi:hypothetical protein
MAFRHHYTFRRLPGIDQAAREIEDSCYHVRCQSRELVVCSELKVPVKGWPPKFGVQGPRTAGSRKRDDHLPRQRTQKNRDPKAVKYFVVPDAKMCITSILNIWWIYERGGRCRMAEWLVQISSF